MLALGLFLLGVALGLPLLAGGRGGPGVFIGPTMGFLFGWLLGAGVTGLVLRSLLRRFSGSSGAAGWPLLVSAFVASVSGGVVVVYALGILGLAAVANMSLSHAALSMAVFIPGDLIKCGVCAVVVQAVMRGLPSWRLDRD
jgi:biotin transport system substrate-specific component